MTLFRWKPEYAVGIKQIDNQHQTLIALINELHDAIESSFTPEKLNSVLQRLFDYTRYHFTTEENLMEASGYPSDKLKKHKKQHQLFIAELNGCQTDLDSMSVEDAIIIQEFLVNWLKNHILKIDTQLAEYLISHPIQTPQSNETPDSSANLAENTRRIAEEIKEIAEHAYRDTLPKEQAVRLLYLADKLLNSLEQP
ncbi:bacteriohemerythrin [Litoribacillus peritrichatus]|uniref:Hemerythrin-like domain-containing protein n=1 Tax=Litoribacillus peritrichatus TaxID=718191 RepID=A0ABP7MZY4_9GAMM